MKRVFLIFLISLISIGCNNTSEYDQFKSELNFVENIENQDDDNNTKCFVHITGEVMRSGVYEMEENSRVIDLVEKAGGFTIDADKEYVNLAERVKDGIKIHIPSKNESIVNSDVSLLINSEIIDINTSPKDILMKLPSVGEKTADSIIKYREKNEFREFEELLNVPGIGKKRLESFKGLISIGGIVYE